MKIAEEKLIAQVFDKSIEALGLMTKKLSDSIEKDKPSKRFYAACVAMQGMLSHSTRYHCRTQDSHLTWKQGMIKESYELADELLRQEGEL